MVRITITGSKKRPNPSEILEGPQSKKQKMDTGMKTECRRILKTLMNHKWGSVFNQPVDPVELGIPDYFTVITHPMDLGTISKKLDDDNYSSAEVFCSDVRLTFSNAMRYNPPGNYVHLMANELYDHFGKSWKLFEAKSLELSTSTPKKNAVIPVKEGSVGVSLKVKKPGATNTVTTSSEVKPKPILSCAVKENSVGVGLKAKKPQATNIVTVSSEVKPKPTLSCAVKEKIESVFGDQTLIELKQVMKGCSGTSVEKGKNEYVKTPQTKEVLLRQKNEVMSDMESRIRAAREAVLQSAKSDLQMKRAKEREKVEKMEKTAVIDDNFMELEKLCQCSWTENPLEKLGLRLKEEYQ